MSNHRNEMHSIYRFHYHSQFRWARIPRVYELGNLILPQVLCHSFHQILFCVWFYYHHCIFSGYPWERVHIPYQLALLKSCGNDLVISVFFFEAYMSQNLEKIGTCLKITLGLHLLKFRDLKKKSLKPPIKSEIKFFPHPLKSPKNH